MGTVNQVLLSEELLNHSKHKVLRLANNSFLNSQIFSIIAKVDLAMTKLSLLVTLGLLVCMKIIESQSNSLPNSKPKRKMLVNFELISIKHFLIARITPLERHATFPHKKIFLVPSQYPEDIAGNHLLTKM